jgi:hypothetical protein
VHEQRLCVPGADGRACRVRLRELLLRFEEPSSTVRWDSPLFVLPSGGDEEAASSSNANALGADAGKDADSASSIPERSAAGAGLQAWEPAPLDDIWEAVSSGKSAKAPSVVAPVSPAACSRGVPRLTLLPAALHDDQLPLPARV